LLALGVPGALGEADFVDGAALHEAGLVKHWQLRLPFQEGQEAADCYLVDDQIYLTTQDGYVYAVHAPTGAIRWIKQITTAGYRIRRPCHANSVTIFVIPPAIIQYDRYSGQPIRSVDTRFPTGSAAVSDGIRLYVGGIDQRIYAFYLDQDFETWKARAGGQIVSQPVLFGRYLYFASDDGGVYACVAENKMLYWRTRTTGSVTAALAVDQNNVFVATRDNSLLSLSPDDGGRRWRTRFSGPLYEPPVVVPEFAFQYCPDDGLTAVNTGTVEVQERVRWVFPRGRSLLTADERLAYVLSSDESIVIAKLNDGEIVHTISASGFSVPMPSPDEPALYIASKDGRLFCARKRGAAPVQADDVTQAMQPPGEAEEQAPEMAAGAAGAAAPREDPLKSKRPGPPIGGKSKVTKEYAGE
jgi:outer membrane protein assembly factor BamB